MDKLCRFGVSVAVGKIAALDGEGTSLIRGGIADALGCARRQTQFGDILQVDDLFATSVAGVHAAGDIAHVPAMAATPVADGAATGALLSRSLIFARP